MVRVSHSWERGGLGGGWPERTEVSKCLTGAGKCRAGRAHGAHQAQEGIEDGLSCGRGRMRNLKGDPEKKKDLTDALG